MAIWSLTKEQRRYNGVKIVSSTNVARKLRIHVPKNESRPRPDAIQKINSKWIVDLNVKCKTLKLPRREHCRKPRCPWAWRCLLSADAKDVIQEGTDELDFVKIKNVCDRRGENETTTHRLGRGGEHLRKDCSPKHTKDCYNSRKRKQRPMRK